MEPVTIPPTPITRLATTVLPLTDSTPSFTIQAINKSFKHQYANIYFVRLRHLKPCVEKEAIKRWKNVPGSPKLIPRVLDVIKGQICLIIGTVYMDMPLKPNVLEDVGRDHTIPAPPPREKIHSQEDRVMLEDESGRIRLIGKILEDTPLVTGVIVGVLGAETSSGDFEAIDLCFPGMAPQDDDGMDIDDFPGTSTDSDSGARDGYIAFVSGLDVGSSPRSEAQTQVLVEYLSGACGGLDDQRFASQISRLVVLGNSLAPLGPTGGAVEEGKEKEDRKSRRHGDDNTSFSPHPIRNLSAHLHDLSQSVAIHVLPGESDPSGSILPQQALPRAMFGHASSFASFSCETNPTYIRLAAGTHGSDGQIHSSRTGRIRTILATSGQPLNDMSKYVPTVPTTGLKLAEATLRWRHIAPTAPDTLWCHPFFTIDPFIIAETPDIYAIGCQPRFATRLVTEGKYRSRVILVPSFAETGILVLVCLKSLDVRIVNILAHSP
ncbi:DNA polymerase alpha/epsilon subunit B-domain-containing protein [Russula earlei]|uniref:DNA polymerase alpha/epsilon subunit B-domain-containing protein n=1 Tax=Russula earlei TaxID=71964 RepID=A0ACC0U782_9AGAM|nr:DNA polymerase alpha/epsilon subunit B-domain-containing protein [Russula earlei]